jgi:2,3-bisphosphoglycerate-independent phosphoglycerate mutase
LSDGNVHSHIDYLLAIIRGLAAASVPRVRVHVLTDGRDVLSMSALTYVDKLEACLREANSKTLKSTKTDDKGHHLDYKIASGGGRMYVTMDRYEADWKIVNRGYDAMVLGVLDPMLVAECSQGWLGRFSSTTEAIEAARNQFPKKTDQDYPPWVIVDSNDAPVGCVKDDDIVINFNFRGDRAIEISRSFEEGASFDEHCFNRKKIVHVDYFGLLIYDNDKGIPRRSLSPNPDIQDVMTQYLCKEGVTQFAISETHKFGHVTYFWNGNRSGYVNEKLELYEEVRN